MQTQMQIILKILNKEIGLALQYISERAGLASSLETEQFDDIALRPKAEVSAVWDLLHLPFN